MGLNTAQRELESFLKSNLRNVSFNFNNDGEVLTASAEHISLSAYDDDVYIGIRYRSNGSATISFIFDKLPKDSTSLDMLNTFNADVFQMKAYINAKGFLIVAGEARNVLESQLVQFVSNGLLYVVSDECVKYLQPLTKRTA